MKFQTLGLIFAVFLIFSSRLLLAASPATLIHSYNFNDGTFKDSVGAANGTLNGAASISGGALQLPGGANGTAYGTLPVSALSGLTSATFEGWFTEGPAANWAKLFFPGNINTSSFAGLTTTSGGSGPSRFDFLANGGSQQMANGPMLVAGTKYYFAVVLDSAGNAVSYYIAPVGGALGAPAAASMSGSNLGNVTVNEFFVGRSPFGGDSDFSGSLDEFRIYNGPLPAGQISANFATGPSLSTSPSASLSVNPPSIPAGSFATLAWSSANAASCTGMGFSTGSAVAGAVAVSPAATTSYSIICTGSAGSASSSATLIVTSAVYTVTPSGVSVTLSPSSAQSVVSGATQAFTVTANAGFTLSSLVGGSCPAGSWSGSVYTTGAIPANCTVSFSASPIIYSVAPLGSNVVINPGFIQSVFQGAKQAFTVTANAGYTLSSSVGGSCPVGSWSGSVYTTGAITGNCTVSFSAAAIVYTVIPSGSNVAISPSAPQSVASGATQAFTITANPGFTLSSAVGGSCPTGSWSGSAYTTGAITANCSVSFSAFPILYTVTPSGSNVVISPNSPQTVISGATQAFTVTANAGFTLSSTVGGTCATGSWSGSVYTTGPIIASCTVSFSAASAASSVTTNLGIYPAIVPPGGSTVLMWNSTNATSCTASMGWSGSKGTSGTQLMANITAGTTYTLTCTDGTGGFATQSANVSVGAPEGPTLPYFQGFESDVLGWFPFQFIPFPPFPNIVRYASGDSNSPLGPIPSASGNYYGVMTKSALNDETHFPIQMGNGGAFYFGRTGSQTDYWIQPTTFDDYAGTFTQSFSMYVATSGPNAWAPQAYLPLTGLIINENPNNGPGAYNGETNMDFSVLATGTVYVGLSNDYYYAPSGHSQLATITQSGWYTFTVTQIKAGNMTTDPFLTVWGAFDSSGRLIGSSMSGLNANGSFPSSSLQGPGYFEIAAWQPGFANNHVAIDDIRNYLGYPNASTAPVVTNGASFSLTVGVPFSYQITATQSPTEYQSWELPPGLSIDARSGLISGTPTTAGITYVAVIANNATGVGAGELKFTISP